MSDEELEKSINRMRLEQRYNQLNPKKTSAGKRFVNATMNNVIKPAVTEAARNTLRSVLEDQMRKAVNSTSSKNK
jgi:succinylglutamate desuccinylase